MKLVFGTRRKKVYKTRFGEGENTFALTLIKNVEKRSKMMAVNGYVINI